MSDDLVKCLWKGVADVDQQQEAADRIEELGAKLAEVTAERDELDNQLCSERHSTGVLERRAETYRAAIPVAYQMALEAGAVELDAQREDSYVSEAISKRICCNGYDCGCKGADVGSWLTYVIRALTPPADLVEQVMAKVKGNESE